MKIIITLLVFCFFLKNIIAQSPHEFYGVTTKGGNGLGTIFKTDTNGNNHAVVYKFGSTHGNWAFSTKMCLAPNGKFYGMTYNGGACDLGVIFEYDPSTNIYTKKIDFNGANGKNPPASLITASNGKLYGMTHSGTLGAIGEIFEYSTVTNSLNVLAYFTNATGYFPSGSLVEASNGKLYGTAINGGVNGLGTVFSFDIATATITNILDFTGNVGTKNGSYPYGSLVQATNGKLYGMTTNGGNSNLGVLFEIDPSNNNYTKKIDFTNSLGKLPYGSLMQATNGNLYGMTSAGGSTGGGVIFEYNLTTSTYNVLMSFVGSTGANPSGDLMQGSNGKLYGSTSSTGLNNLGVLFEFDLTTLTYNDLFDFDGVNGANPGYEGLSQLANGKIYGIAEKGGHSNSNSGTIFEYDPVTNTFTKKIDINNSIDGAFPSGSLVNANNGKIYGTTKDGGANGFGTLYEYDPNTNIYTKKIDFDNINNGRSPSGDIMLAANGKIYGTTSYGGSSDNGVLFEYDPLTSIFIKHLEFGGSSTYAGPFGKLIQASNGKLYGTTNQGGYQTLGTIFEFDPTTNIFTTQITISSPNGGTSPNGALAEIIPGKLYGCGEFGGTSGQGVIFKYDISSNTYSNTFNCTGLIGRYPTGGLIQAPNNKLYGISSIQSNFGGIFEYDTTTTVGTSVISFSGTIGEYPDGSLLLGNNGKAYGFTSKGGINDFGVLFELNTSSNAYTKKLDFTGPNGAEPHLGSLIRTCQSISITSQPATSIICTNGFMTQTATAIGNNLSYQWYFNNAIIAGATNTVYSITNFNTSNVGNYYCGITNGCRTVTTVIANATVNSNTAMPLTVSGSNTICAGNNVSIYVNGANTYTWSTGSNNNNITISPTVNTTYSVTGTDLNNCLSFGSILVNVNPLPILFIAGNNSVCVGSSATFSVSGANTYTWNTAANANTINVLPLASSLYSVSGTDLNNCVSTQTINLNVNNACADVWPGDANSDGVADNIDVLELGLHFTLTGPPRTATNNSWQSYQASNWVGLITNGKNVNNSDCNGDGLIDQNDTAAIFNNYGLTHAFKPNEQIQNNPQLNIVPDQNFVVKGNWGSASIYLGDNANQITNVNGVALTVMFDNTYIVQDSAYVLFNTSFLNASNQNLNFRKKNFNSGLIYAATTHTNNSNVTGNGKIATFYYKIKPSLIIDTAFNFNIAQANQSNSSGTITPLTAGSASVLAVGATVNLKNNSFSEDVSIYPNPTKNNLKINSSKEIQKIEILSITGQILLSETGKGNSMQFNLELFANGTYLIKIYSLNEPPVQKIIIKN